MLSGWCGTVQGLLEHGTESWTQIEWSLLCPKVMISEALHLKVTKQHSDLVWVGFHCYILGKKMLGKTGEEEERMLKKKREGEAQIS